MKLPLATSLLFALLFACLPFAPAIAQVVNSCQDVQLDCDEGAAYAQCAASLKWTTEYRQNVQGRTPVVRSACTHPTGAANPGHFYCDVGSNPGSSYGCFLPDTQILQSEFYHRKLCTERASPSSAKEVRSWTKRCVGGCWLEIKNGSSVTMTWGGESFTSAQGDLVYTGYCNIPAPVPDAPPEDHKEEDCKPMGAFSMCLKANGDQCLTSGSGKKFCWAPGTASNETSGNENVATGPGDPPPPNSPPLDNSGWKPPVDPKPNTQTSPTGGGTTINTTVNVSVSTNGGTTTPPPPPPPPPPPCDPSKGPCDATAGGGAGCDAPPQCSGDVINCAVLVQVWRNRCSPNGNKASGSQCTSEGTVAGFSCSGDEILCRQALTQLEQKCKTQKRQSEFAADAGNGVDDNEDPESVFGEPTDPSGLLNGSRISLAGGSLFPTVDIMGRTWTAPPEIYAILDVIRLMVIAFFTFYAITRVFR